MGGLSEGESVELSLREEMVQRALLGELLWLTGHSWQCLWKFAKNRLTGKAELGV